MQQRWMGVADDAAIERRIGDPMLRMTLDGKIGQVDPGGPYRQTIASETGLEVVGAQR